MSAIEATFLVAALSAAVLVPVLIRHLTRHQILDMPNHRSLHGTPTPRGGGIAVAVAVLAAGLLFGVGNLWMLLVPGAVVLGLVGFADDIRTLGVGLRIIAQVAAGTILSVLVWSNSDAEMPPMVLFAVCLAWPPVFVNAFNFMDGCNGMSSLHALVIGLSMAWTACEVSSQELQIAALAISGAVLGFMPYNFPRARIFLGDVGSYFIGYWLGGLLVLAVIAGVPLEVAVAPYLYYMCDTTVTLVKRWRMQLPILDAHRDHKYQRLVASGWSHPSVALMTSMMSAAAAASMIAMWHSSPMQRRAVLVLYITAFVVLVASGERNRGSASS